MKFISMCSGIEAASAAYIPLGWIPVAFSEIEKFPCKVLANHHPSIPNHGDFTAFDWSIYQGAIDVLVAGTPCQAFSVAGLRNSLADARGNLTLEFIRAANAIQPRFIIWENVPGVLSTSDNAFGCFLAGLVGCNEPIVAEQGWANAGVVHGPERSACWRVLDAQYFGLAQRRKRVFVVTSPRGGPNPAEILFEWESLRRHTPPSREARQGIARGFEIGPSGGCESECSPTLDTRAKDGPIRNQIAPCALDVPQRGGMGRIDAESETLIAATLTKGYGSAAGNDSQQEGMLITHTLTKRYDSSEDGCGRGVPLVAQTVTADMYRSGGATAGNNPGVRNLIAADRAVRRLTPLECERLQGFTDHYTAIPKAADGPRYRALGNSMAVPVMQWIGRRIMEAVK